MTYKDYYKVLGVSPTAAPADIKRAYRKLALKYHPDRARGDRAAEDTFKDINEANEVLADPVKRKKYDRFGADWKVYEQAGEQPGGFDWSKYAGAERRQSHGGGAEDPGPAFGAEAGGDFFELLFGQTDSQRRTGRRAAFKGEDLAAETLVSLEEAYQGATRLIQLHGQTIRVTVRPGVADGQVLRIAGKGGAGSRGGMNGDLFLTIRIAAHPVFRRAGDDLYCDLPLDLYTAVLGGKAKARTLKGTVNVDIPGETQNGKELRLLGLGMPVYGDRTAFGNLFVKLDIRIPEHISPAEVALFENLKSLRL